MSTEPSPDPIQSVQLVHPDGPTWELNQVVWEGRLRRFITIGHDSDRDVCIRDETVSGIHCFFRRERETGRLYVEDGESKNSVFINGTRVLEAEVKAGDLLSLGGVVLLARGRAGDRQRPILTGDSLHAILLLAQKVYGSDRKVQEQLLIKRSTLQHWIEKDKFKPPCND